MSRTALVTLYWNSAPLFSTFQVVCPYCDESHDGPIQIGITKNEAQQLFEYVRKDVGENEVVVFGKPRALSLFTGRAAAVWHHSTEDEELWNFFRQINASYLIVGPENVEPYDQTFIRKFVDRNPARFQQTFANADFQVYRIVKAMT